MCKRTQLVLIVQWLGIVCWPGSWNKVTEILNLFYGFVWYAVVEGKTGVLAYCEEEFRYVIWGWRKEKQLFKSQWRKKILVWLRGSLWIMEDSLYKTCLCWRFTSRVRWEGGNLNKQILGERKWLWNMVDFYVNTNSFVIISELCFVNCQGFVLMRP